MAMAPLTAAIPNELKMDNMASTKVATNLQIVYNTNLWIENTFKKWIFIARHYNGWLLS
jgi:hypothetical protein